MRFNTASYEIGYPVFDAKFLNGDTLLVTGGARGEAGQESMNRLTALTINFSKRKVLKRFRELKLSEENDAPTVMDVENNLILVGCNEGANSIRDGHNHNLQKYVYVNEHLKYLQSASLEPISVPLQYQKLIRLSKDGAMAATATSKIPTVIHILDAVKVFEKYEIETNNEVRDLDISPDGKALAYITQHTLEIISTITGKSMSRKTDFKSSLSKVRFQDNDNVLIAANVQDQGGISLVRLSISKKLQVSKMSVVSKKVKGIVSLDVNVKNAVIAIAGNDNSVILLKMDSLKHIKTFNNIHTLGITKVAFSPDGKYVASVSASKTIHVVEIPEALGVETHMIYNFFVRLFQLTIFLLLCAAGWFFWKYNSFDQNDISDYFTLVQKTTTEESIRITETPIFEPEPTPTTTSRTVLDRNDKYTSTVEEIVSTESPSTTKKKPNVLTPRTPTSTAQITVSDDDESSTTTITSSKKKKTKSKTKTKSSKKKTKKVRKSSSPIETDTTASISATDDDLNSEVSLSLDSMTAPLTSLTTTTTPVDPVTTSQTTSTKKRVSPRSVSKAWKKSSALTESEGAVETSINLTPTSTSDEEQSTDLADNIEERMVDPLDASDEEKAEVLRGLERLAEEGGATGALLTEIDEAIERLEENASKKASGDAASDSDEVESSSSSTNEIESTTEEPESSTDELESSTDEVESSTDDIESSSVSDAEETEHSSIIDEEKGKDTGIVEEDETEAIAAPVEIPTKQAAETALEGEEVLDDSIEEDITPVDESSAVPEYGEHVPIEFAAMDEPKTPHGDNEDEAVGEEDPAERDVDSGDEADSESDDDLVESTTTIDTDDERTEAEVVSTAETDYEDEPSGFDRNAASEEDKVDSSDSDSTSTGEAEGAEEEEETGDEAGEEEKKEVDEDEGEEGKENKEEEISLDPDSSSDTDDVIVSSDTESTDEDVPESTPSVGELSEEVIDNDDEASITLTQTVTKLATRAHVIEDLEDEQKSVEDDESETDDEVDPEDSEADTGEDAEAITEDSDDSEEPDSAVEDDSGYASNEADETDESEVSESNLDLAETTAESITNTVPENEEAALGDASAETEILSEGSFVDGVTEEVEEDTSDDDYDGEYEESSGSGEEEDALEDSAEEEAEEEEAEAESSGSDGEQYVEEESIDAETSDDVDDDVVETESASGDVKEHEAFHDEL